MHTTFHIRAQVAHILKLNCAPEQFKISCSTKNFLTRGTEILFDWHSLRWLETAKIIGGARSIGLDVSNFRLHASLSLSDSEGGSVFTNLFETNEWDQLSRVWECAADPPSIRCAFGSVWQSNSPLGTRAKSITIAALLLILLCVRVPLIGLSHTRTGRRNRKPM